MGQRPKRAVPTLAAVLATVVLAWPLTGPPAAGQDLGAAARREKEKRAQRSGSARVYGDEDLRRASGAKEAEETAKAGREGRDGEASPGQADADAAAERDEERAERARAEANWRKRAGPVRSGLEAAEEQVRRLEAQVESLERERLALLPMQDVYATPALDQARRDLDQARTDLAAARKAWDELEEEARRAGVPPGWLRER